MRTKDVNINMDEVERSLEDCLEYNGRSGAKVKLVGALFHCTKCGRIRPASMFGFRVVKGVVRNQAQCSSCR